MASSASGQDEPNRALWLATRAGKMEPSCPLGTTCCIPQAKFPQKPYNKFFIDQVCSVKMAGYWPRSINTQKKPHTWSTTLTYAPTANSSVVVVQQSATGNPTCHTKVWNSRVLTTGWESCKVIISNLLRSHSPLVVKIQRITLLRASNFYTSEFVLVSVLGSVKLN